MKKWLSAMLAICLLMIGMTCVTGEGIYNNGEAPELICVTNEQGEVCAALIKDAQGNVIASIPENAQLKIVYAGDRYEEKPDVEQLLYQSLDTILKDKHIENAARYIETDLFYVELPEEYTSYLTDDTVVEMVLKPLIMQNVSEVLVLTSVDGEAWEECTNVAFNGDGTVTVGIKPNCMVAFAIPAGEYGGLIITTQETSNDEISPNFTPSITGKPDPALRETEDDDGNHIGQIVSPSGTTLAKIANRNEIVVTPFSECEANPDVITYEHLKWAFDLISAALDLGDLPAKGEEGKLASTMDLALEGTGLERKDLTVSDLFDVAVYGDPLRTLMDNPDSRLEITVERNFRNDEVVMVLCASDLDQWHVLDEQYVTINEDGSVTLSLEHQGVLAFLVERTDADFDAAGEGVITAP